MQLPGLACVLLPNTTIWTFLAMFFFWFWGGVGAVFKWPCMPMLEHHFSSLPVPYLLRFLLVSGIRGLVYRTKAWN